MSKIPLTVIGAELMRNELHRLKTVERPAVIGAIAEARAQGDLSENAEYDAAKEKQSFVEGRIVDLESKLGSAQIIDPKTLNADGRCVFGSTVVLEDTDNGDVVTYQ
ncbi:MAG: transcription elongation factor GreA, partial [Gallionella sp.]|nr:transcription elongation factor GreA [Gallionella sp.]